VKILNGQNIFLNPFLANLGEKFVKFGKSTTKADGYCRKKIALWANFKKSAPENIF
jgi:hypothetical protein